MTKLFQVKVTPALKAAVTKQAHSRQMNISRLVHELLLKLQEEGFELQRPPIPSETVSVSLDDKLDSWLKEFSKGKGGRGVVMRELFTALIEGRIQVESSFLPSAFPADEDL